MFCSSKLSTFQRKSLALCSMTLILTALLAMAAHEHIHPEAVAGPGEYMLALLPALPFLTLLFVTIRYLSREQDEFVRTIVLQSLFWGLVITMAVSSIWGFLSDSHLVAPLPEMFYIDLFLISTMFSLLGQRRKYQ